MPLTSWFFKLTDMNCKDAAKTPPRFSALAESILLMHMIHEFREWYKRPMHVNSWFRTKEHNAKAGGSPNSQHMLGRAADFAFTPDYKNATPERKNQWQKNMIKKWQDICTKYGRVGGIGFYNSFFHLDIRPVGKASKDKMDIWYL